MFRMNRKQLSEFYRKPHLSNRHPFEFGYVTDARRTLHTHAYTVQRDIMQ